MSHWQSKGYIDLGIMTYVACTANGAHGIHWPRLDAQPKADDLVIGAVYHPGWDFSESVSHPSTPNSWRALSRPYLDGGPDWSDQSQTSFPGRKPKLGWYNGADTRTLDWEIKWALEHGVQFFMINWYRERHTFTSSGTELQYPIAEVLDNTRLALANTEFKDLFQYTISWDNSNLASLSQNRFSPDKHAARTELLSTYYPYWRDNLFSDPQYARIQGRPLLYVFSFSTLLNDFEGDKAYMNASLDLLRAQAAADTTVNMDGIIIVCGANGAISASTISDMNAAGCDSSFAYTIAPGPSLGAYTPSQAFNSIVSYNTAVKDNVGVMHGMFVMSVSWKCEPKSQPPMNHGCGYDWMFEPFQSGWGNSYDDGLQWISGQLPAIPMIYGRRVVLLDAWNEWSEGHAIAPTERYGFAYLNKVRRWLSSAAEETSNQAFPQGTALDSLQTDFCNHYPSACPTSCVDSDQDGLCNGFGDI